MKFIAIVVTITQITITFTSFKSSPPSYLQKQYIHYNRAVLDYSETRNCVINTFAIDTLSDQCISIEK